MTPVAQRERRRLADLPNFREVFIFMSSHISAADHPAWKRVLFSDFMLSRGRAQRIATVGVMTALCIVANMFLEIKFYDVQFSLTIFVSVLTGMLIGPLFGFGAVFLGDFLGYVYNNWGYMYMPWVGLSSALFALVAGLVMGIRIEKKWGIYVKLALICVITFLVCTAGVNSAGFYFYNKYSGFSTAVIDYAEAHFGGTVSYFAYVCYRLIFKMQILNSVVNYALLFAAVPLINAIGAKNVPLR